LGFTGYPRGDIAPDILILAKVSQQRPQIRVTITTTMVAIKYYEFQYLVAMGSCLQTVRINNNKTHLFFPIAIETTGMWLYLADSGDGQAHCAPW